MITNYDPDDKYMYTSSKHKSVRTVSEWLNILEMEIVYLDWNEKTPIKLFHEKVMDGRFTKVNKDN